MGAEDKKSVDEQITEIQLELLNLKTIILTGAGVSVPLGISPMKTFLDKFSGGDQAYQLAYARSKEIYEVADIEYVMFFLESLNKMKAYDLFAFPFLEQVQRVWGGGHPPTFNAIKSSAKSDVEHLRVHVHKTCSEFDPENIWNYYRPLCEYVHGQNDGQVVIFTKTTISP